MNKPQVQRTVQGREEVFRNAEELRGELFTDLDRLAFALEMEGMERLTEGDEAPRCDWRTRGWAYGWLSALSPEYRLTR